MLSSNTDININAGVIFFWRIHSFFSEEQRTHECNRPNRCGLPNLLSTLPVWDSVGVFGPDAVHSDKFSQVRRSFSSILNSDRESRLLIKNLKSVPTSAEWFLTEVKYQPLRKQGYRVSGYRCLAWTKTLGRNLQDHFTDDFPTRWEDAEQVLAALKRHSNILMLPVVQPTSQSAVSSGRKLQRHLPVEGDHH